MSKDHPVKTIRSKKLFSSNEEAAPLLSSQLLTDTLQNITAPATTNVENISNNSRYYFYGPTTSDTINQPFGADVLQVEGGLGDDVIYVQESRTNIQYFAGFSQDPTGRFLGNLPTTTNETFRFDHFTEAAKISFVRVDLGSKDGYYHLVTDNANLTVIGSDFNDTFTDTVGEITHTYSPAREIIIQAGKGNDFAIIGFNRTIYGEEGNDFLWSYNSDNPNNSPGVKFFGGEGNDTLYGGVGNDFLDGGINNDILIAGTGDNQIVGGEGDDIATVASGTNVVNGGQGADGLIFSAIISDRGITVSIDDSRAYYDFGSKDNTAFSSIESFSGTTTGDTFIGGDFYNLTGTGGANGTGDGPLRFEGGGGDDLYYARGGISTFSGGNNNDTLSFARLNRPLTGNLIIDLRSIGSDGRGAIGYGDNHQVTVTTIENIVGTQFDDYVIVSPNALNVKVSAGSGGSDSISFEYSTTAITIDLSDPAGTYVGFDNVVGSTGNDIIKGDAQDNILTGFGGDDEIIGGNGNDTIAIGIGASKVTGGDGFDTLSFENLSGPGVFIDLTTASVRRIDNTQDFTVAATDTFEAYIGTASHDTFVGGSGNDYFRGGRGNDTATGGDGNDVLDGGLGINTVDGGSGTNTLSFAGIDRGVTLNLTRSVITTDSAGKVSFSGDAVFGDFDRTNFLNIHIFEFGNLDDHVDATSGNDIIYMGGGNDYIHARVGDDLVYAGDGHDIILGGRGDDELNGGGGNDRFAGGLDNDTIFGDLGNDRLLGARGNDALDGGDDNDTIAGGAGDDTIMGGLGNDLLLGQAGVNTLTGGGGRDTFWLDTLNAQNTIMDFERGTSGDYLRVGNLLTRGTNFVEGNDFLAAIREYFRISSTTGNLEMLLDQAHVGSFGSNANLQVGWNQVVQFNGLTSPLTLDELINNGQFVLS